MTDDERGEILVTARLLRACAPMLWLAIVLIGLGAFALLRRDASIVIVASIAAGLTALIYGIRTHFDACLFEDVIEERLTMEQLDRALRLRHPGRSWSDRCRGARRLPAIAAVALLVQMVTLIVAA